MTVALSPWQLSDGHARLMLGALVGEIDVQNTFAGITLSISGAKLRVFRVELPPANDQSSDQALECYVRGNDLVGTYIRSERLKIRAQIYWRAFEFGEGKAPAIDLIVSVQTSLLDSDPTLDVRSNVPAQRVLNIHGLEPPAAKECTPTGGDNSVVGFEGRGPACWLFRLPGEQDTYVEMVHPSDHVSSRFQELGPGEVEHSTRLFRGPLEKGVILRSRLRGAFVPRSIDIEAAVECYRDFVASEPPLTT